MDLNANELLTPCDDMWAVSAFAPCAQDSINLYTSVRLFDDTIEEGVGFDLINDTSLPGVEVSITGRAETEPLRPSWVGWALYYCCQSDRIWSPGKFLGTMAISTDTNWTKVLYRSKLPELNVAQVDRVLHTDGVLLFELTRVPIGGMAENLRGDFALLSLGIRLVDLREGAD